MRIYTTCAPQIKFIACAIDLETARAPMGMLGGGMGGMDF